MLGFLPIQRSRLNLSGKPTKVLFFSFRFANGINRTLVACIFVGEYLDIYTEEYRRWKISQHVNEIECVLKARQSNIDDQQFNGLNERGVSSLQSEGRVAHFAEHNDLSLPSIGSFSLYDDIYEMVCC